MDSGLNWILASLGFKPKQPPTHPVHLQSMHKSPMSDLTRTHLIRNKGG